MKGLLKYILATVLGIMIYSFIGLLIFMGIMGSIVASSKNKDVKIEPNTVLYLKFDKQIVDRASDNPFENFNFQSMEPDPQIGLNKILANIKKAKKDENIKGVYLSLTHVPAGMATIEEIRNALLDFKESGKFVYTYAERISQKAYYLASASDKIYMNPVGYYELKGLRANVMFVKGALEKLGIEPVIFRYGKFKSAIEPFFLDKMSEANKEQTMTFVSSIWNHMATGIAKERGLTVEEVNKLVDGFVARSPKTALESKFIDGLMYKDEIIDEMVKLTGAKDADDLEVVKLAKYDNVKLEKDKKKDKKAKIAVVYASGSIVMGKGESGQISSIAISKAIRKARKDSTIEAIVFRVNSGGGDALASDIIWREAVLAQREKPFIVSMGDYAASGGYYIACPADVIVASPTTLTGSIGVFGLMFNTQKLMNQKLGITFDGVQTNTYADLGNSNRKMTEAEKEIIQSGVNDIYETFITHVGEGRDMSTEAVDSVGQGRVWSGENAMEIGLVDVFGGLNTAVEIAAEKAGLEEYKIVDYPKSKDPFEEFIKSLTDNVQTRMMKNELGESYVIYKKINKMLQIEGVQARMPYEIELY